MKTSALLAVLGKIFTVVGAPALTPHDPFSPSLLMLVGLAGLALLTHRSERWRKAARAH